MDAGKVWIGVDIGGTKTAVVLSSEPPVVLGRIEFATLPEQGPQRAIELVKESIYKLIDREGVERARLGAIGVSCGGPLDQSSGVIMRHRTFPPGSTCRLPRFFTKNLDWRAELKMTPTPELLPSTDSERDRERAT